MMTAPKLRLTKWAHWKSWSWWYGLTLTKDHFWATI